MTKASRLATVSVVFLALIQLTQAQTLSVLHYFSGGSDGASPYSGLTMDAAGNLYGTVYWGGVGGSNCSEWGIGCGAVYQLKRTAHGFVFNTLYEFTGFSQGGSDGANPYGRVVFGPDGALYGTTWEGGARCPNNPVYGCGTVFRLQPSPTFCRSVSCPWRETTLYRFTGGPSDGALPYAGVAFDSAGNVYGTAYSGGINSTNCYYEGQDDYCGAVFQLSRVNGAWTESVLYFFTGADDGSGPVSALTLDAAGNLYGTAQTNGRYNNGTVYELTRSGSGWTQQTLYAPSCGSSGCYPVGDVIFDAAGNLYATAQSGGSAGGGGTAFELTLTGGAWSLAKVYAFTGQEQSGPRAGLSMDSAGNLYGTSYASGSPAEGQVFKLTPSSCCFTFTLLHQFGQGGDGLGIPMSNVVINAQGNLYGTASGSVAPYAGGVWEITPH